MIHLLLLFGNADSADFVHETITDLLKVATGAVVIEHVVVVCLNLIRHALDFSCRFFFNQSNFMADFDFGSCRLDLGEILSLLLGLELVGHVHLVLRLMGSQSASLRRPGTAAGCHVSFYQVLLFTSTLHFLTFHVGELSEDCLCNGYLIIFIFFNVSGLDDGSLIDLAVVDVADGCEALLFVFRMAMLLHHLVSVGVCAAHVGLLLRFVLCGSFFFLWQVLGSNIGLEVDNLLLSSLVVL